MMKVKDLMEKDIVTVREETTFRELLILISNYHMTDFPVVDNNYSLKGMIYEKDLLVALYPRYVNFTDNLPDISDLESQAASIQEQTLERIVTSKVFSVSSEDHIMKAGSAMLVEKVASVPVVSNGVVVGLIRQNKIFAAIMSLSEGAAFEQNYLRSTQGNKAAVSPLSAKSAPASEKRLYKRVKVDMTVAYKLASLDGSAAASVKGRLASAVNISTGGMLLRLENQLPANTLLNLAFDLSGNDLPIRRMGRVIRCMPSRDPGFYEAGIMFLAMTPEEIKQIEHYLNTKG